MNNRFYTMAVCAAAVSLLAACGGGSDDEPAPSPFNSLITVTSATTASQNGIYGSTAIGLTDVEKTLETGTQSCTFAFNNVSKAGDSASSMSGKVSFRENENTLNRLEITVNGVVYASGAVDNSTVDRSGNAVRFTGKTLASTASDTNTIVVTGLVPMRGNRPSGC